MAGCRVAVDVHYDESAQIARAAAVLFDHWTDGEATETEVYEHRGIEPYVSGEFFRRELPALLPLLQAIQKRRTLAAIIVDGHVDLSDGHPGLGRHVHQALPGSPTVIGVAKNAYQGAPAQPILRGTSQRPLWVSSTSSIESAVAEVLSMHGPHRIPTLLKQADHLARNR